jgi:hypothetical protein
MSQGLGVIQRLPQYHIEPASSGQKNGTLCDRSIASGRHTRSGGNDRGKRLTHRMSARTVTGSLGGTKTEWVDVSGAQYLRMQGMSRATQYGYSIYELQAYPPA